jgi:Ca2+-binding EF-hand superfamily protein
VSVVTKFRAYAKEQELLDEIFAKYDTNRSGFLEKDQILHLMNDISPSIKADDGDAAFVIARCDVGHTGSIARDEVLAALGTWKALAEQKAAKQSSKVCALS